MFETAPSSSVTVYVKLSVPLKPGSGVIGETNHQHSTSSDHPRRPQTTVAFGVNVPSESESTPSPVSSVTTFPSAECPHQSCNRYPSPPADHSHPSPQRHRRDVRDRTVIISHRVGERVSPVETRIRRIRETAIGIQRQGTIGDIRHQGGVRRQGPIRIESTPSPVSSVTTLPPTAVSSSVV